MAFDRRVVRRTSLIVLSGAYNENNEIIEITITGDVCNNSNNYGQIEGSEDNCYCLFF